MDGAGTLVSMQGAGVDMYSPKRSSHYGDFLSQHFSAHDFAWDAPKQEPVDTDSMGMHSIPPRYEAAEDNFQYGYTQDSVPTLKNAGGLPSTLNGLGLSYVPMDGFGSSANQAISPLFDTTNTMDSINYQRTAEQQLQQLQNIDNTTGMGFQDDACDFALAYTTGVDYASAQAIASPPEIYLRTEYNEPCELGSTAVSYTTSLQVPDASCQASSVTWSQNFEAELVSQPQSNCQGQGDSMLQITDQSVSIQTAPPWGLAKDVCSHDPTLFNNSMLPVGSPFENSPLSSINHTPLVPQSMWQTEYPSEFIGPDKDQNWQNATITTPSPVEEMNLPAAISPLPMTNNEVGPSKAQFESLVSVIQVSIKKETESPPVDYQPRMDDLITNFDSSPNSASRKRKRTKFTTEGAEKVRGVRNKGACGACHYRKIPCSIDEICNHCLKAAKNNPTLAGEICLRDKLQDSYVGVKTIFGSLDSRRGALDPLLKSLSGEVLEIKLSVSSFAEGARGLATLPLRIRRCNIDPICRWKGLSKVKGIHLTKDSIYAQRYAVVPGSVSSAAVETFAQQILPLTGTHSGKITPLLDNFLDIYSKAKQATPLRSFVRSTLKVAALNGLVQYGTIDLRDGSYDLLGRPPTESSYVSPTIHDQIRLIAASGLKDAEQEVFRQIDEFKKLVGPNKHARIVGGICLMRLLLLYRDRAIRDAIRLSLPRQKLLHRARLEQSTYMYKRLTVAYGILCRDANTPLTTPWVAEGDRQKGTSENRGLQELFVRLHQAYREFCKNLTEEHDSIFKGLVVPAK